MIAHSILFVASLAVRTGGLDARSWKTAPVIVGGTPGSGGQSAVRILHAMGIFMVKRT